MPGRSLFLICTPYFPRFAVINNDPDLSLAWIQLGPYRKRLNLLEGSRDDQRRQQKAASRAYLITEKVSTGSGGFRLKPLYASD